MATDFENPLLKVRTHTVINIMDVMDGYNGHNEWIKSFIDGHNG